LAENFQAFAIENAPKLSDEDLQIAGLSKEDVEKIIAIYKALPYHADIIREEFEAKKKEARENAEVSEVNPEEKHEKTEETLLPESAEEQPSFVNEQPLEVEKSEEQHEEKVEKLESEEVTSEISEEEPIIIMDHDVEYENINGHRFMLVKDESGIEPYRVKDGQELELAGKRVRIKYG
jgi:DNA segregation ATPase FtsK/SpoIIIE-like protein